MARIRTVKPEYWSSEQVMYLSRDARLLFIGLWNFCDDAGNHPASPIALKARVFPGDDDLTSATVLRLVAELIEQGLVFEYEAAGKAYWHVTGWHHQKIEKPNYKHPQHPETPPKREIPSTVSDESATNRLPVADHSTPESKVKEGNGVYEEGSSSSSSSTVVNYEEQEPTELPTSTERIGDLCKQLRQIGIRVSPDVFREPTWPVILRTFANDEIVAVGRQKRAAHPHKAINAAYLVPALNDKLNQGKNQAGGPYATTQQANRNDRNAAILAEASGGYPGGGNVIEGNVRFVG